MQRGEYEYQSEFARKYFNQGLEQGIEKGQDLTRRELASKLLARGNTVTEVAELTGLTTEEVLQLRH